MSTLTIEVITTTHHLYAAVCEMVKAVYLEKLQVEPTGYPAVFVAAVDMTAGSNIVAGAVGIKFGSQSPKLQVERYCRYRQLELMRAVRSCGADSRSDWAEATTFAVRTEYPNCGIALVAYTIRYLAHRGIKVILQTESRTVGLALKRLGTCSIKICEANLDLYEASEAERQAWRAVYWRVQRPVCSVIATLDALHSVRLAFESARVTIFQAGEYLHALMAGELEDQTMATVAA